MSTNSTSGGELEEYSSMEFPNFTPLTKEQIQSITQHQERNDDNEDEEENNNNKTTMVFYHEDMMKHYTGLNHPERSDRVRAAIKGIKDGNVDEIVTMIQITKRNDTREQIMLCHDEEYVWTVEAEVNNIPNVHTELRSRYLDTIHNFTGDTSSFIPHVPSALDEFCTSLSTGDVMISEHSLESALLAVDCVLYAIDNVFLSPNKEEGMAKAKAATCKNAFCITRPPGHHASSKAGSGFCIFNNVAIGASYAQNKYPDKCKKVLIIDWDVHHGNGTQEIFYTNPSVLMFQTQEEGIYPGTAHENDTGEGNAEGTHVNKLYPKWTGIETFGPLYMNDLKEFLIKHHNNDDDDDGNGGSSIDLILISCGFDSHVDDYLGDLGLKSEDFGKLTQIVCHLSRTILGHDRVVVLMEGGYNLQAIGEGTAYVCKALSEYSHGHGTLPEDLLLD